MNTLISLLLMMISGTVSSSTYHEIAVQVLRNIGHIENMTLSSLAKESMTSPATVNKFCHEFDYRNFSEFKIALNNTSEVRTAQMMHRIQTTDSKKIEKIMTELGGVDYSWTILQKQSLLALKQIHEADRIIVTGAVFPVMLSLNFIEDMNMLGKYVYPKRISRDLMFSPSHEKTLYIVISLTGRIYQYFGDSFINCNDKDASFLCIGNKDHIPTDMAEDNYIYLPSCGDDEKGNNMILLTLQYLKYLYYQEYCKKYVCD